tara:strand:+ start:238 stop:465 length:228 start_codon:yes stop_codon:yes gene_type:complete
MKDLKEANVGAWDVLVKNVDTNLLRNQIHYLSELLTEDNYFQGSPLSGPNSPHDGLEGVQNLLENMYDTAMENKS